MKISPAHSAALALLLLSFSVHNANAQFGFDIFRPLQNLLKPVMRFFGGGPKFTDDGTQSPQATGNDKLFPDDCGRDEDKGTGKLCFPDGLLCQNSKLRAICNNPEITRQARLLSFHVVPTYINIQICFLSAPNYSISLFPPLFVFIISTIDHLKTILPLPLPPALHALQYCCCCCRCFGSDLI